MAQTSNFEILQETHLLKLLDKMCKYEMDPIRTVGTTEQTRDAGWTDGWTDGRTDGRTEGQMEGRSETNISRNNFVIHCIITHTDAGKRRLIVSQSEQKTSWEYFAISRSVDIHTYSRTPIWYPPIIDLPIFENLFFFFLKHWKEIVKSGAISCWTDQWCGSISNLKLPFSDSWSTNNHRYYLSVYYGNVYIFSQYVTQM